MSNICTFYVYESTGWLSYRQTCNATDRELHDDTYENYCKDNYERCPNYRPKKEEGGCFLTSACTEARGLADDCYELTVLRGFRDSWLKDCANGDAETREYYRIAPTIVKNIHASENCAGILADMYEELVRPCVDMIVNGRNEEAYQLYKSYTLELKKAFF